MCIIHDQKFACGCWRKSEAELTHCIIAMQNFDPVTHDPTPCSRQTCKSAIRPSIWYCIEHALCKQFNGNYEDLRKNMSERAVEHVLSSGGESRLILLTSVCGGGSLWYLPDYNFELKPPMQAHTADI